MDSRLVLVIEGDEPTANQLAAAIREADYEVVVSNRARAGLDIAIEIKPDCVVCGVELPDEDGYWVARHVRAHASPVALTPFVLLSPYDDAESRLEGFEVGADVYMSKPYQVEEVVAQVDALVKLASRLRQRRDSILSSAPEQPYGSTAIEGDMRHMSIATVLSVLGMERRTGVFEVVSKKRRAQIEVAGGYVVHGTIGGTRVTALAAMGVMLSWKVGRFSFTPLPECEPPPSRRTVQALLLDAAKAEDEAAASLPAHGIAAAMSSMGGPPSRPDDTGPPSSRAMREAQSPVSLAFDLITSRRAEDLPAAEVAAAVDSAVAAYESGLALPAATDATPRAPAVAVPKAPAPQPSGVPTVPAPWRSTTDKVPVRDVATAATGRRGVRVAPEASREAPVEAAPASIDFAISVDVDSISVDLAELDPDAMNSGERMLHEERSGVVGRGAGAGPLASPTPPSASRTPPAGTQLGALRRTPAIMPPPNAGANMGPLPAPPAPPRPATPPRPAPKATPEKGRGAQRSNQKKN